MNQYLIANWTLLRLQLFGRKRRWVTLILMMLPVLAGIMWRTLLPESKAYEQILQMVMAKGLLPVIAMFYGTTLLSDETEGRTLVFIFSRPVQRGLHFLCRYWMLVCFLGLYAVWSVGILFVLVRPEGSANWARMMWDVRAMTMGAACYAALGFLLSSLVARAVGAGLIYILIVDTWSAVLPGFIKMSAISFYVKSLMTVDSADSVSQILESELYISENQALISLSLIAIVLSGAAAYRIWKSEPKVDNPLQTQ